MIASSGVETRFRALGTRFVAIFRVREICDVDYNLSSKITRAQGGKEAHKHKGFDFGELFLDFKISRVRQFFGPQGAREAHTRTPRVRRHEKHRLAHNIGRVKKVIFELKL